MAKAQRKRTKVFLHETDAAEVVDVDVGKARGDVMVLAKAETVRATISCSRRGPITVLE